jgi:hypothetical protein
MVYIVCTYQKVPLHLSIYGIQFPSLECSRRSLANLLVFSEPPSMTLGASSVLSRHASVTCGRQEKIGNSKLPRSNSPTLDLPRIHVIKSASSESRWNHGRARCIITRPVLLSKLSLIFTPTCPLPPLQSQKFWQRTITMSLSSPAIDQL